ncbi:MAG: Bug family tripartite tricarboxylate transporter substrate binding protein [Lautropia sp.]
MKSSTAFAQLLLATFLASAALLAGPAAAQQSYPDKPIRLIVPYPPGGTTDALARMISQKLSGSWGQPVAVENRPGGDTIIATDFLAKSAPDGYTLLLTLNTHVINPHTHKQLPYDPIKDFAPVATVAINEQVMAVSPAVPANNLQELIALAKSKPGTLNHGAGGTGGIVHLTLELFNNMAGVKIQHVPYKGAAQAMTDLISGQIQLSLAPPILVKQYISTGKLKAFAVSGERRVPSLPEVPTFAESGWPDFDVKVWYGFLAPAGTPKPVIEKLSAEFAKILALPETKTFLETQGFEPFFGNSEQFSELMKSDLAKYGKAVKSANIKAAD